MEENLKLLMRYLLVKDLYEDYKKYEGAENSDFPPEAKLAKKAFDLRIELAALKIKLGKATK